MRGRGGRDNNFRGGMGLRRDRPEGGLITGIPTLRYLNNNNAAFVYKWLDLMKIHCIKNYTAGLEEVFDKNVPRFPVIVEPEHPGDDSTDFQKIDYKAEKDQYLKKLEKINGDCNKLVGDLIGQLDEEGRNRVLNTEIGRRGFDEMDPIKVLGAISAIYLNGTMRHENPNINLVNMTIHFNNLQMHDAENIYEFKMKFEATVESLRQYGKAAGKTVLDDEKELAIRFIFGLNNNYTQFKESVERNLIETPTNVINAYDRALMFGRGKPTYNNNNHRNVFLTQRQQFTGRNNNAGRFYQNNNNNYNNYQEQYNNKDNNNDNNRNIYNNNNNINNNNHHFLKNGENKNQGQNNFIKNNYQNSNDYVDKKCFKCGAYGHMAYKCKNVLVSNGKKVNPN